MEKRGWRHVAIPLLALLCTRDARAVAGEQPAASNVTVTSVAPASTAQGATTSSTIPFEIRYSFQIGLYPTAPVRSVTLLVGWSSEDVYCDPVAIGQPAPALRSGSGPFEWTMDFGDDGLRQSQRVLRCTVYAWHGDAWWEPAVAILEAKGLDGEDIDLAPSVCLDCGFSKPRDWGEPEPSDYDSCGRNICGDVIADGLFTASDALRVLQASLGMSSPKYAQQYDTDRSGKIAPTDALRVLRRSVGRTGDMFCAKPPAAECDLEWTGDTEDRLVRVSLESSSAAIGSLQFRLASTAPGSFEGDGDDVDCSSPVEAGLAAFQKHDAKTVDVSVIALAAISSPATIAECRFGGFPGHVPTASQFSVGDVVATDVDAVPASATLAVSVAPD